MNADSRKAMGEIVDLVSIGVLLLGLLLIAVGRNLI